MSIDFQCQGCGQAYRVGSDKAGRMLRCKLCGAMTPIPDVKDAVVVTYAEPEEDEEEAPEPPKSQRITHPPRSGRLKSGGKRRKDRKKAIALGAGVAAFLIVATGAFYGVQYIFSLGASPFDDELLKYVSADSAGAVVVHPANVMKSRSLSEQSRTHLKSLLPGNLGVEIGDIDVAAMIVKKSAHGGLPNLGLVTVVFHFNKSPDMEALAKRIVEPKSSESSSHAGKTYTKMTTVGNDGTGVVCGAFSPDKQTLVIAPEEDVKKFLSGENADSPLKDRMKDFGLKGDLTFVMSDEFLNSGGTLMGLPAGVELPEADDESAKGYHGAAFCLDLDATVFARLELEAGDAEAAQKLQKDLGKTAERFKSFADEQHKMVGFFIAGRIPQDEMTRLEVFQTFAKGAFVRRKGQKVSLNFKNIDGIGDAIVPAISESIAGMNQLREMAAGGPDPEDEEEVPAAAAVQAGLLRMNKGANVAPSEKLKKIGQAIQSFHEANGYLPMPGPLDKDGKLLLSWRVQLLPFLGEKRLHSQFRLDEPWDSSNNRPLVDRMPDVYASSENAGDGKTQFVVFTGDGTPFNGTVPVSFKDIEDGLPGTLLVIETAPGLAVEWTKPQDVAFTGALDQRAELGLGLVPREGVQALMADGNVIVLSDNVWPVALKSIITYNRHDADKTLSNFIIGGNPPQISRAGRACGKVGQTQPPEDLVAMPRSRRETMPEIIYYVAMSLDGRIAASDGGIGWLTSFESPGEDYGYAKFYSTIDAVIVGRATYEQSLTFGDWPFPDKPCWVFSRRPVTANQPDVTVTSKSPVEIANELQARKIRRAWLVGGGKMAASFHAAGLITEIITSTIPVVLGAGIPLFDGPGPAESLSLVETKKYSNGVTQMRYTK